MRLPGRLERWLVRLKAHIEDEDQTGKNLRCEIHRRIGASRAQKPAG